MFLQFGKEKLLECAKECGVDGLIIADLPPEAEPEFFIQAKECELCTVLLASELTTENRLLEITRVSTGFIYYVPQLGITGLDLNINEAVRERIKRIKSLTTTPVCIGIGVKTREDVKILCEDADGVIVGTRIVDFINTHRDEENIAQQVGVLIKEIIP
ncbi:Tryptophan synthase alpha chain [subsurface metagenome]